MLVSRQDRRLQRSVGRTGGLALFLLALELSFQSPSAGQRY